MKALKIILEKHWLTLYDLMDYKEQNICNWCWSKRGFNFSDKLERLPFFDSEKKKALLLDLRRVCCIHDKKFYDWGWVKDFIVSNYDLANDTIQLLHWTGFLRKILLWIIIFVSTTIFWFISFNFKYSFLWKH